MFVKSAVTAKKKKDSKSLNMCALFSRELNYNDMKNPKGRLSDSCCLFINCNK